MPCAWVQDEGDERVTLSYVSVVASSDAMARAMSLSTADDHASSGLLRALESAIHAPMPPGRPTKPRELRLGPHLASEADELRRVLKPHGIQVAEGPTTVADELAFELCAMMDRDSRGHAPTWFADASPSDVSAYFAAAERFLAAEPWTFVRGDDVIAVRIADEPWRFLVLMGNGGTGEVGFVLYERWEYASAAREAAREDDEGAATRHLARIGGAWEAVSEEPLWLLSPVDADVLLRAGHVSRSQETLFSPARRTATSCEAPHASLRTYATLLEALARAVPNHRRGSNVKSSLRVGTQAVCLEWPVEAWPKPAQTNALNRTIA
ncbi:MAG: hypothetical protein ACYDDF_03500 [Thermoplasmatota archaeon]